MSKNNLFHNEKIKETFLYLFFGGCTTLVNIITYYVFSNVLGMHYIISNIIAWIIAVSFAYITNKMYVFNSKSKGLSDVIQKVISFFAFRLLTGILDMAIMWISVDLLDINDLIMKIVSNILVIILNYIFSKIFIFKK
jgi:putative flippase GtrA